MPWTLFIALRYLLKRRKEKFISIVSVISILGVIVGVAALIVVLSIMTGFDNEIKDKIIGTYSHVVIVKTGGIEEPGKLMDAVNKKEHVIATAPFIDEPVFIKYQDHMTGVLMRGLDPEKEPRVSNVKNYIGKDKLDFGTNGVIVGKEMLNSLGLRKGDKVVLLSPSSISILPFNKKKEEFTVIGTFASGRYDYDANMIIVNIEDAKRLLGKRTVTGIGIKLDNEFMASEVKKDLQRSLRSRFFVKTWMDLDRNLMRALAVEKRIMFIVLGLIIIVACFNIASSLIMQVLEKTNDIGVLRAIGATARGIKNIFIILGFAIGFSGALIGVLLGVTISQNINAISDHIERLTGFELFPNDVYYLSEIPAQVVPQDVLFVAVFSLILAVLASFYPAWKASRFSPVDAMRYQ